MLNLAYLCIVTAVSLWLLTAASLRTRCPVGEGSDMLLSGTEGFFVFTFATGLVALSGDFGIDLMAIRLGIIELLAAAAVVMARRGMRVSLPLAVYGAFLVWVAAGLFYGDTPAYGVRMLLKYLYPLIVALLAAAVVRDIEVWVKAVVLARVVAVAALVITASPFLQGLFPGVFWYGTAVAINFISVLACSLTLCYYTDRRLQNLAYALLFMLPCFFWNYRTSILGTLVCLMAFFYIRHRLRAFLVIAVIALAGVLAVFYVPSLNEKMFKADRSVTVEQLVRGNVSMDDIETNARLVMWQHLYQRFYADDRAVGSGTGSVQHYMYTNDLFGGLRVPHNDYLQILCDNGLVGLAIYLAALGSIFAHCVSRYRRGRTTAVRMAALAAGSAMAGVAVTMLFDNSVNYSMATMTIPYCLYGMMIGLDS